MNKFKVGDHIYIDGEKFIILSTNNEHPMGLDVKAQSISDDDLKVAFSSGDDGIKPIQREYAILGDA